MSRFRTTLKAGALICALFLAVTPPAGADELQDITILYKKGEPAKALERLDAYLAAKPKDAQGVKIAQARFLKGLILAEQGKTQEAIKIYVGLTEDYPELPEPYNNLAVLYASQNQLDKAKNSLEMAIGTHPSYTTAHENLGDIYAKMASQAYDKALQLDKSNAAAQTKLALVKEMFSNSGRPNRAPAKNDAVKLQPVAPAAVTPPPAAPAKPETPKTETAKPAAEAKPAEETKAAEAKPAAPAKEKPAANKPDNEDEVIKAVHAWAKAWSNKNVGAYLAAYAKDFKTPGGESRGSWEKTRKERVGRPKSIHVAIEAPRVTMNGASHASVTFRQDYKSDSLSTSTMKTLALVKSGDKWLILQERVGR